MPKRLAAALGAVLAATVFVAGCNTDSFTTPASRAPSAAAPDAAATHSLLGGLLGVVTNTLYSVGVVQRLVPLDRDVSGTFTVGPLGAAYHNSAVGVSVVVPPGALSKTVTITVTAKAGNVVNYQFQPEGLQFALPVTVTQDLSLTNALTSVTNLLTGKRLTGAYYSSSSLQYNPLSGTASVNELLPTQTLPILGTSSFQIRHFSGYILASCNSDEGSSF